jgi:hypothetical protein
MKSRTSMFSVQFPGIKPSHALVVTSTAVSVSMVHFFSS